MTDEITENKGTLQLHQGFVVLKTAEKTYYPIHLPQMMDISMERMKTNAASVFKQYVDSDVTISGYLEGDIIFEARVTRTYVPRIEGEGHGEEWWNNRVPKANILWTARRLPGYDQQFSVDVRQMITVNDSIIYQDLVDHNLLVVDPNKCNEDLYLIYHHSRVKEINPYFYEYDKYTFGCEFFMYPNELREIHKGDCDDWGIELASYLITAGIPEWRVRCVVGCTHTGEGHLTVYVLADDLATWYHLNSTTPWTQVQEKGYSKLTDFPTTDDPTDFIGIKDPWFSFNNKFAWHSFESHASEEGARKIPWFKNFRITPLLP